MAKGEKKWRRPCARCVSLACGAQQAKLGELFMSGQMIACVIVEFVSSWFMNPRFRT